MFAFQFKILTFFFAIRVSKSLHQIEKLIDIFRSSYLCMVKEDNGLTWMVNRIISTHYNNGGSLSSDCFLLVKYLCVGAAIIPFTVN